MSCGQEGESEGDSEWVVGKKGESEGVSDGKKEEITLAMCRAMISGVTEYHDSKIRKNGCKGEKESERDNVSPSSS